MKKGRIQTQGGVTLLWMPEGQKSKYAAGAEKAVRMGKWGIWKAPSVESWYCPACKKVITDLVKNSDIGGNT
jgi:hypothetical protein